ncbi:hypothetical protein MTO96_048395 [Rhipicephalus appendiculatus]
MAESSKPLLFSHDHAPNFEQRSSTLSRRPDYRRPAQTAKADFRPDDKAVPTTIDLSRDSSKSVGTQMRSTQARSSWSMYSSIVARIRPPPGRRHHAYSARAGARTDTKHDAKNGPTPNDLSRDSSKSIGVQMRSAQAHSFWSMYSSVAARVRPMRYFTVADLACAVATILATAVVILSLVGVLTTQPVAAEQKVFVSGFFGRVQGLRHKVLGHTDVYAFLGVPYAHPPLGEMRFRRTYSTDDFTIGKGLEIDATSTKPACVQSALDDDPLAVMSEDCLHLNIWTTSRECLSSECADKTVLIFLHDGSFQAGSNRDPLYDGTYLSGLGDVVVVVPNYRLGALGFLYTGISVAPGNVGLYDQLLVIEWTRHNIGRFGGNVSNLVLVGYGSGATASWLPARQPGSRRA